MARRWLRFFRRASDEALLARLRSGFFVSWGEVRFWRSAGFFGGWVSAGEGEFAEDFGVVAFGGEAGVFPGVESTVEVGNFSVSEFFEY